MFGIYLFVLNTSFFFGFQKILRYTRVLGSYIPTEIDSEKFQCTRPMLLMDSKQICHIMETNALSLQTTNMKPCGGLTLGQFQGSIPSPYIIEQKTCRGVGIKTIYLICLLEEQKVESFTLYKTILENRKATFSIPRTRWLRYR